jgi:site-specific DNA recombinase
MARRAQRSAPSAGGVVTALIYTRVSTEDQGREGLSLPAQLAECRRYALQQGWIIDDKYSDQMSGTRNDRPGYQALLAEVRTRVARGEAVVVVVAALDRFGRKLLERVARRDELKDLGVATHSVRDGGAVSDLQANILASVAQEEVRRLGERVSQSWKHVSQAGWHKIGGPGVAWGYRSRPATAEERQRSAPRSVLEPHEIEAPYVREAFARVAGGEPARSVWRWVTGLDPEARGGRHLTWGTFRMLLRSPVYVARTTVGVPGYWQPLVEQSVFERVEERFAEHSRTPHQASQRYSLTSFLRCWRCGDPMHGTTVGGRRRYHCGQAKRVGGPSEPCYRTLTADLIEPLVATEIGRLLGALEPDRLKRAWDVLRQPVAVDATAARRSRLEATSARGHKRINDATRRLVDGDIDKADYDSFVAEERASIEAAEAELARLAGWTAAPMLPPLRQVMDRVGGWEQALRHGDVAAQREVLRLLVDHIEPVRIKRGRYRVRITWTPLGEALATLVRGEAETARAA